LKNIRYCGISAASAIVTPEKNWHANRQASFNRFRKEGNRMPRGDKDKYTDKEKRQAQHIEEGYREQGVSEDEAERRAWATVNAVHHGGEKPGGGGYGKPENHEPMRKGGRKGGRR
jgi:hypothetical protein